MRSVFRIALAAALVFAAASATGARAEDDAAGDLAFWQSIQNSTNPAEYQAYLNAFPNGRFKALALLRLKNPPAPTPGPTPNAAPGPAPAPVAGGNGTEQPKTAEQPEIVGDGANKVVVQPIAGRVGQKFKVSFTNFPDPNRDIFVVVRAGTPDFDPMHPPADLKILYQDWIYNKSSLTDRQIGPFAPGNYEARYLTMLYNNDNKYEASARTMFSVR